MKWRLPTLIFILFFCSRANAYMEFSADFSYDKSVFGDERQNSTVNRMYKGSVATYLFAYTAIELNFSLSEEVTTVNETIAVTDTDTSITGYQNNVENMVYGVGIRQALAARGAAIRPMISVGYAKQFIKGYTDYTFYDSGTGQTVVVTDSVQKSRQDSVFGTFILQFRLSQSLAIRGSVNTVFPAFETDKAKDNLKYLVGLTWVF